MAIEATPVCSFGLSVGYIPLPRDVLAAACALHGGGAFGYAAEYVGAALAAGGGLVGFNGISALSARTSPVGAGCTAFGAFCFCPHNFCSFHFRLW